MKKIAALILWMLLAATAVSQKQSDWTSSWNNTDIAYRSQVFDNMKACYVEFRDQKQGKGVTTFDADVQFRSTVLTADKQPTLKNETEHVVIAPSQTGNARIHDCAAILKVNVSLVERH